MSTHPAKPDSYVLAIGADGKPLAPSQAVAQAAAPAGTSADKIQAQWAASRAASNKPAQVRLLYGHDAADKALLALVSVGEQKPAPSTAPDTLPQAQTFLRNERLEHVRLAAAAAVRALRDVAPTQTDADASSAAASAKKSSQQPQPRTIAVDTMQSPHAAAVGARLAAWENNHWRTRGKNHAFGVDAALQGGNHIRFVPLGSGAELHDAGDDPELVPRLGWTTGEVYAESQNWARELMEAPANHMTPTIFCKRVQDKFASLGSDASGVSVTVHDEAWAKDKGMGSFLSVANGTEEPAKMLEIHVRSAKPDAPTLALVGKGITFDTGGISLKPGLDMKLMRADMGGAATVVSATYAIAKLGVPINVIAVTPLTENMPSGHATKPGDVVVAMNGLTIEVDNTDAEGRLVLADALTYVTREYKPHTVVDVATLTGAMLHALGHEYSGAFVEDESLWQELKAAGEAEADRFWRMPLDDVFLPYVDTSNSDIVNVGRPAGSACAAIFLKQFVEGLEERSKLSSDGRGEGAPRVRYAHLDIAGTMEAKVPRPYQPTKLTGRPTRPLVEFARRLAASAKAAK